MSAIWCLFAEGFFSKGWKMAHLVLHKDSMVVYYAEQGASKADGCVVLKVNTLINLNNEEDIEVKFQ